MAILLICARRCFNIQTTSFKFRPWELKSTNSVDCMDGLGSAIRIDSRGKVVMRILPLEKDSINEEGLVIRLDSRVMVCRSNES